MTRTNVPIVVELEPPNSADALDCLQRYVEELDRRFEDGFDTAKGNGLDPEDVRPPHGWFVVARLEGQAIGCGALKRLEPGVGEIKRVWVSDKLRGRGVARRIMAKLESIAHEAGLRVVRLDTNRTLTEARTMYAGMGYREIASYNDNPFAHHWFEKLL